jgi:hypothetical protein
VEHFLLSLLSNANGVLLILVVVVMFALYIENRSATLAPNSLQRKMINGAVKTDKLKAGIAHTLSFFLCLQCHLRSLVGEYFPVQDICQKKIFSNK